MTVIADERYVKSWDSDGLDYLEHLDGIPWHDAPPPPLKHEHWAQTRGIFNCRYVERCACGAFGPKPFFMLGRDEPRVAGDIVERRLLARGQQLIERLWPR